ncbi:rhamnogalacturonan acetylesterase [Granulicella sp. 5B5]|uniref:rhamnogalacturonan acetylesterase n=1 Tax=Granulicella sp. 5B5 TaxID=1617967 RepID=UPI0015F37AA0|nr:rhamnogalacturonan acetylesterase [Granulicella sp. 5B5]QMV18013.1 rhamnogalacturonan acetylesterase [Granulicella sp. 5B5]
MHRRIRVSIAVSAVLLLAAAASSHLAAQEQRFTCAATAHGAEHALTADTRFDAAKADAAYGFDLIASPSSMANGACSSDKPFFFSIAATDGNYQVTVKLGGTAPSTTTVRAESRRLFVDELSLPAKGSKKVIFNVNVRTAVIAGAAKAGDRPVEVRLKPREIGALDWDNKLTLEFNGEHPSVRSITIKRVDDVPTVYIAGDSTVVDQDKEPWAAWGQMLPVFFGAKIVIANEAESGETIKSFVGERRLAKVESTWKRGDYLLVQFAHNDQKPGRGFVPIPEYKDLMRRFIADARAKGVTPILVTAMNRRKFDAAGKIVQTLGDYPQATREIAAEQHTGLIDLNAMSKTLFETLGDAGTLHAFVHYPANTFPDQPEELHDDTHFTSYGAYELARAIVQTIRDQGMPLKKYLRPGIPPFDPAHPLPFSEWHLPSSPFVSTTTPYGR